jgi:hypothetical protein
VPGTRGCEFHVAATMPPTHRMVAAQETLLGRYILPQTSADCGAKRALYTLGMATCAARGAVELAGLGVKDAPGHVHDVCGAHEPDGGVMVLHLRDDGRDEGLRW